MVGTLVDRGEEPRAVRPWFEQARPPLGRARELADARRCETRVHVVSGARRGLGIDQPDPSAVVVDALHECVLGFELPVRRERRGAVPEALVDRRLGRGESGERLASPGYVVELRIHHPSEHPATPVGRVHRDHGDRGHRQARASGHGHVEGERAGRAHDAVAVADRERAIAGEQVSRVLVVLVEDGAAEPGLDGLEELQHLVVTYDMWFEVHGRKPAMRPVRATLEIRSGLCRLSSGDPGRLPHHVSSDEGVNL